MIIQCEECRTKFKLDDAKVTEKGVKVRCAKCKHLFVVRKEESQAEPEVPFENFLDKKSDEQAPISQESELSSFAAPLDSAAPPPLDDFPISFNEQPSLQESHPVPAEPVAASDDTAGDFDFGTIDFSDAVRDDLHAEQSIPEPAASAKSIAEPTGLDFSDDDIFGTVVKPAEDEDKTGSIDFGIDDFSDSFAADDNSVKTGASSGGDNRASNDAPFSLGEIDFGDELTAVAVQQVNPDELKPAQESLFASISGDVRSEDSAVSIVSAPEEVAPLALEDAPPLSIASRRKESSKGPLFAVIGIIAVIVAAFFAYTGFFAEKSNTAADSGRISVRGIKASYVKNSKIGELFVITGEAVNEFDKPRASLEVRGTIFGKDGKPVAAKKAFCGNALTKEQLSEMPQEKIDAALANQFGDSLANMEVSPGKAIPFVIVIPTPSAEAKDYGVEAVGSAMTAAKQQ